MDIVRAYADPKTEAELKLKDHFEEKQAKLEENFGDRVEDVYPMDFMK